MRRVRGYIAERWHQRPRVPTDEWENIVVRTRSIGIGIDQPMRFDSRLGVRLVWKITP